MYSKLRIEEEEEKPMYILILLLNIGIMRMMDIREDIIMGK